MKFISRILAVAVLFIAVSAYAGQFDGVYKFSSRTKGGQPDMQGWWGMMVISSDTMSRIYHSPDGKSDKYYVGKLKPEGGLYSVQFDYAYNPSYVGNKHTNKIELKGTELTMTSEDGVFKEVWQKK